MSQNSSSNCQVELFDSSLHRIGQENQEPGSARNPLLKNSLSHNPWPNAKLKQHVENIQSKNRKIVEHKVKNYSNTASNNDLTQNRNQFKHSRNMSEKHGET